MSNKTFLLSQIKTNINNGLKNGYDLNTLLHPLRPVIPPHEYGEIETLDDAVVLIERALDRSFIH